MFESIHWTWTSLTTIDGIIFLKLIHSALSYASLHSGIVQSVVLSLLKSFVQLNMTWKYWNTNSIVAMTPTQSEHLCFVCHSFEYSVFWFRLIHIFVRKLLFYSQNLCANQFCVWFFFISVLFTVFFGFDVERSITT